MVEGRLRMGNDPGAIEYGPTRWAIRGSPVAWFHDPPWSVRALRRNAVAVRVEVELARTGAGRGQEASYLTL